MSRIYYTGDGRITAYSLACGYITRKERDGIVTTLWHEHNCYHVRQHDHNEHRRVFWDIFDNLTAAIERYKRA